ncbi:unnamed protein product [Arctia plantaginis]|uniref:Vitellogenin domain-containing protein n=1 Tax=Arctia plantaginis TaxID=874455 RepID=A0A8S1BA05_ARCPL|nr:unnamed protein product [Arctia plantaginis]
MKLLLRVLMAIIAAVTSSPVSQVNQNWPWQVGKAYHYDVYSHTLNNFEEGISHGIAFKAQYYVSVKSTGRLVAKLDNALYTTVKTHILNNFEIPSDLKYKPLKVMDQTFEIFVDGGRVVSINVPSELPIPYTNFLKGLVGALQADLSPHGNVHDYPNGFDKTTFQGLFKKMETDVTGECETLYSVSPMAAEWRRELTKYVPKEDPIEIVKSKNYGVCSKRADVYFGVPEGAVFKGMTHNNEEKQMIKHAFEARLLVGKQGPIYKAEAISSVTASPIVFGKQKPEVVSYIKFTLNSVEQDTSESWKKTEEFSSINSLLYTSDNSSIFTYSYGDQEGVSKAYHYLKEMSPLLQDPNNLSKEGFLLKFNFLVNLLASFNSKQLIQMTESLENSKTSKNLAKTGIWTIYRDALSVAGTTVAYEHIKSWVLNKKIVGEEAAEVITVMGASLSNPSLDLAKDFFKFAIEPAVVELKYVNNSALLATSKLLRSVHDPFIEETVIPYFNKELNDAIQNDDTSKAHVYITVLGNLAHPRILKVYSPYLEGHIPVTKYLRTQIVTNLKALAYLKNEYVRAVLFSILRNTGDIYEVRVAAALNLFIAVPTAEMMQVLAHMTHFDPSTHVRAVLSNSITSAASLKDPRFKELSKIAQSVLNVITKDTFDSKYSENVVLEEYLSEDDYNYFNQLETIGSDNSFLPKYLRSIFNFKVTGFNEESEVTLSVSDVKDFFNYFMQNVIEPTKVDPGFKFSAKHIVESLNIKRAPRQPLEGALFINDWNLQKLITFNEKDFHAFISDAEKTIENLLDGIDAQYTKTLYLKHIKVTCPLANGMPYILHYSEPAIIMAKMHAAANVKNENNVIAGSLTSKIDFTYSKSVQSSISFIDVFGDQLAVSGVLSDLQLYVPIIINTELNGGHFKIQFEPLHGDRDVNLIQFNVVPYTGMYKRNSVKYDVEPIKRTTKTASTDLKFGHSAGMFYQVQGHSYSSDYKDLKKLFSDDLFSNIGRLIYQKDIAFTQFDFKYLGRDTIVKSTTFIVYLDTLYNQKYSGEMGLASPTKHVEPHSVARREEITKKVASDIDSATVQLLDFSAEFDGPKKTVFVFTGAYAYSNVDSKFQTALFAHSTEQINAVFRVNIKNPKIHTLNFEEALKNEVKLVYDANIKYQNSDILLQGYGERSREYTKMLKNDPMAKKCLAEISQNNFFQNYCYNVTLKAYAPDFFTATVTFKDVDPNLLSLTEYTYNGYIKPAFNLEEERSSLDKTSDDTIYIETKAFYYDNYISYKLTNTHGSISLENLEITWDLPYIMSTYAPIYLLEDSTDSSTGYENLRYCAVDDNKILTFSGRSYEYALTSSWHVVMVEDSEDLGKGLVILARRPSANQEEVYVSYQTEDGKFLELNIKPDNIDVKSNGNKTCDGALTMYWNEAGEVPLLEYYSLGIDLYVFDIQNKNIRLVYDKHRLVVFTDEYYGSTMGICGQSSTEIRDDYMTPYGIVDLPEHYGASFSLEDEFSHPKTVALKKEAKLKAYQPVTKYTGILHSDDDWIKAVNETPKQFSDKNVK